MRSSRRVPLCCATAVLLMLAAPAIAWSGNKVVLTAAQSSGGVMVDLSDGTQGVSLDKSCQRPWPEVTCIEWSLATPLPVGWWHGTVDFSIRERDDRRDTPMPNSAWCCGLRKSPWPTC